MHLRSVVLPHPDGPTTQANSPCSTVKVMLPTAWVAFTPLPYVLPSRLMSSTCSSSRYSGIAARQPRCHASVRRSTSRKSVLRRYPSSPISRIAAHIGPSWNVFFEISRT